MTYPLLQAAIATERIADMHRQAAARRLVLAALRARRARRRNAASASGNLPAPGRHRRTNGRSDDTAGVIPPPRNSGADVPGLRPQEGIR